MIGLIIAQQASERRKEKKTRETLLATMQGMLGIGSNFIEVDEIVQVIDFIEGLGSSNASHYELVKAVYNSNVIKCISRPLEFKFKDYLHAGFKTDIINGRSESRQVIEAKPSKICKEYLTITFFDDKTIRVYYK